MIAEFISKSLQYLWLHGWKYGAIRRQHQQREAELASKPVINVVFMAIDLAYWHYQGLYELMASDGRFLPTIVLSPCQERLNSKSDMQRLRQYFQSKGTPFVDYDFSKPPVDIRRELQPDIIFYTQPYEHQLCDEHDCRHFYDLLVCYMPYAFWTSTGKGSYNLHFHNQAWRLYYSTQLHLKEAQRVADNQGRNVRVTGYANADGFLTNAHRSPWREMSDGHHRKRIIWAPHFSITSKSSNQPTRACFLWTADLMVKLAHEYSEQIQIAFKPHPALLSQLYQHPDWGHERTDSYYAEWQTMENTQLEQGEYIDLFMTSDAMIHDSGSFVVEYLYAKRPVMFVSKNMQPILDTQSEFGLQAYQQAYIGRTENDIRNFIDKVVLRGDDPMLPQRERFFSDYLLPPRGKSVAQNMFDDIVESLKL